MNNDFSCISNPNHKNYQDKLKAVSPTDPNGPERSQMFYLGLGASLREGLESYLYMLPLGAAYEAQYIPIPGVLGAVGGFDTTLLFDAFPWSRPGKH